MKLTEYLMFAALLIPTLVVVLAAIVSLAAPAPEPEYRAPITLVSSAGLSPADVVNDD